jgi:hypothetical protein
VLGCDDRVLEGIGRLLAPGAHATALLSVTPRDGDGVPAVPPVRRLRDTYARYGLELADHRPAAAADIAAARSSWAKRLRAGTAARPVTLLRIRRPPEPGLSPGGSPPPSGPGR